MLGFVAGLTLGIGLGSFAGIFATALIIYSKK